MENGRLTAGEQPRKILLSGELHVDRPVDQALALFTPVGERAWVDGWEPHFPAGELGDGTAPGTTFTTEHDGNRTFWVVVARDDAVVRYARVTPGIAAGLVEVTCRADPRGGTRVVVTYELTALGDDGEAHLAQFAAGYEDHLADWARAIATRT